MLKYDIKSMEILKNGLAHLNTAVVTDPLSFIAGWGGAVAKWSKALLLREKVNKTIRFQVLPPAWAGKTSKKVL